MRQLPEVDGFEAIGLGMEECYVGGAGLSSKKSIT